MFPSVMQMAAKALEKDPVVALTYGFSGCGKTVDLGYSFPNALFIGAPGALVSIEKVCGYKPIRVQAATIMDVTKIIEQVSGHFSAVVVDDFSFLAEQTFSILEKKYNGYRLWGELREAALQFRDKSRFCGVHVLLNAWEQAPKVNQQGHKVRGGPQLSGKLPESIPALCDIVLRAMPEPRRRPWPVAYRCIPADPSYVMKDRYNIANVCDPAPMNLGEILRAAGVHVERSEDMPDQEEKVEAIASLIVSGDPSTDAEAANEVYTKLLESGASVHTARWTLRDAMDRAVIRRSLSRAHSVFVDTTQPAVL